MAPVSFASGGVSSKGAASGAGTVLSLLEQATLITPATSIESHTEATGVNLVMNDLFLGEAWTVSITTRTYLSGSFYAIDEYAALSQARITMALAAGSFAVEIMYFDCY